MTKSLTLPTPGEILATEFLEPMGLTQYRLAQAIHVPQTRIAAIIKDGRSITADTALRLARFFGTSVEFWMNLQSQYDADMARASLAGELESIEPFAMAWASQPIASNKKPSGEGFIFEGCTGPLRCPMVVRTPRASQISWPSRQAPWP